MTLPKVEGGEGSGLAEVVAKEASHEAAVRRGVRRVEPGQLRPEIVQGDEVRVRLGREARGALSGRAARAKRTAFGDAESDSPVGLDLGTIPDANLE